MQYSVFEIEVDPAQWALLKSRIEEIIDEKHDSLRYYYLGSQLAEAHRTCRRQAGGRSQWADHPMKRI